MSIKNNILIGVATNKTGNTGKVRMYPKNGVVWSDIANMQSQHRGTERGSAPEAGAGLWSCLSAMPENWDGSS